MEDESPSPTAIEPSLGEHANGLHDFFKMLTDLGVPGKIALSFLSSPVVTTALVRSALDEVGIQSGLGIDASDVGRVIGIGCQLPPGAEERPACRELAQAFREWVLATYRIEVKPVGSQSML